MVGYAKFLLCGDVVIKVSKMVDYSVLVLCQLVQDQEQPWSANRLADNLGLNQPTLAKICRLLAKAGMLRASRGAQGGYLLNQAPEAIDLYSIMLAVDGDCSLVNCSRPNNVCACIAKCHLQPMWNQIDNEISVILKQKTLIDFAQGQHACARSALVNKGL